jgi:transposase
VSDGISGAQFVGIDLHRRRSVIVRVDEVGSVLDVVRITNSEQALLGAVRPAGKGARVAVEATYGWYWAVDALQAAGFEVHLAHPYGMRAMRKRKKVKTDQADAYELANLLRLGSLPEAWIAPPATREVRELVRQRMKLVHSRASVKASVHALLAKHGITLEIGDYFGVAGGDLLDAVKLPKPYADRLAAQRRLILMLNAEVDAVELEIVNALKDDRRYVNLLKVKGIGPVFAAIFVAEIGDVTRFSHPEQLACWAGLTPRHYESDTTVRRGHISKEGSTLVRWAAIETVHRECEPLLKAHRDQIIARRGKNAKQIATVAAARKLMHVVYWVLRDGEARCLATAATAVPA